jgi:predicted aspartyl protease
MKPCLLAVSVTAIALVAAAPASAREDTAADIVARVRDTLGLAKIKEHGGMRMTGTTSLLGNPATAELIFDPAGRSRLTVNGPISAVWGYDGTTAWTTDFSGETRRQWFHEEEDIVLRTLIISGLAFAEVAEKRFTLDKARSTDDVVCLAFSLDGTFTIGHVGIDRSSWRPVAWSTYIGRSVDSWILGNYVSVSGVTLPMGVKQNAKHTFHPYFNMHSITRMIADPARFAMPSAACNDVRFDPAAPAALEMLKAPSGDGHLLVKATLDDVHEGWFIFDTGAGMNVLDTGLIKELHYDRLGVIPIDGVGGAFEGPMVRAGSLHVGPITMAEPLFMGVGLAETSRALGVELKGALGYSLLARCVAEIDIAARIVRLHDPATFTLVGGQWSPLTLADRSPGLEGAIEGHKGIFKIDTGAADVALSVHAPAVKRLKLLEGRQTTPFAMKSTGGVLHGFRGFVTLLELAGTRHEHVYAEFITDNDGSFTDGRSLGNVGGKILADYTLVLDYQNNRAALVPKE